jgi:hypothetical protein
MPKVRFYLDKRSQSPLKPVYLVLNHQYKKKPNYEAINQSIPIPMWNGNAKGTPESIRGTSDEAVKLRDRLKAIKHQLEVEIPDYLQKEFEIPKKEQTIDNIYGEFLNRQGLEGKTAVKPLRYITEYIQRYIDTHQTLDKTTICKYARLKDTMQVFADKENESLLLKKIDYPWLSKYATFLTLPQAGQEWGYENGYIHSLFTKLNSTLSCFEIKPFSIKKIIGHLKKYNGKETDNKDMDMTDLIRIYKFDCVFNGEINKSWLKARDLYVWSYFTGHRHNELYAPKKSSSIEERIDISKGKYSVLKYVSDKTGEPNETVLNDICLEIIERWRDEDTEVVRSFRSGEKVVYKEPLLPVMTSDKCNQYLHELMEEIAYRDALEIYGDQFTRETKNDFEPVSFYKTKLRVRYVGAKRKEEHKPMYEWFTFKTSRTSTACVLAEYDVSDANIASVLNNDANTVKKHYARRNQTKANLKSKEVMDLAVRNAVGQ